MKRIALSIVMLALLAGTALTGCPNGGDGNTGGNGFTPPTPASFTVSELTINPLNAKPAQAVTVTATVTNNGGSSGSHDVEFNLDGTLQDSKSVSLQAGASTQLSFSTSRIGVGSYGVTIGNSSGTFSVVPATSNEEILSVAALTSGLIETFRYELNIEQSMTGVEGLDVQIGMYMHGAADAIEQEIFLSVMMSMEDQGIPEPIEFDIDTYIIGQWLYMKIGGIPGVPPAWIKMNIPQDELSNVWQDQDIAIEQYELLQDIQEVELLGTEFVNGVECYKYSVILDEDRLWDLFASQNEETGLEDFSSVIFNEFEIVYWIAKDTYFFMKYSVWLDVEAEMERVEGLIETLQIEMMMEFTIFDINETVDIVLPPEAETAVEVPFEAYQDI